MCVCVSVRVRVCEKGYVYEHVYSFLSSNERSINEIKYNETKESKRKRKKKLQYTKDECKFN